MRWQNMFGHYDMKETADTMLISNILRVDGIKCVNGYVCICIWFMYHVCFQYSNL